MGPGMRMGWVKRKRSVEKAYKGKGRGIVI